MPTRRKARKRNKSSPLVQGSTKKSKNYKSPQHLQSFSATDCDYVSNIIEAEGSESDSQSLSKTVEPRGHTSSNTTSTATVVATAIMLSPDHTQQSQSILGAPLEVTAEDATIAIQPLNISQPAFINPTVLDSPINMSTHQQPQMLTLQGPQTTPYTTMMPGLSEQDVIRVASMVKQMLHQEIDQIVQIKVDNATQSLTSELKVHHEKYKELEDRCRLLEHEVHGLKVKHDDAEQYSRRMCLRLAGLPETEHEDVHKLVLEFADKVQANISPVDIDRVHRIGKTNSSNSADEAAGGARSRLGREIIIKFTNSSARLRLLKGRARLREDGVKNIFINEDLTPARKKLAFECRKIKRLKNSVIKKTWIYAGYPHILDTSGNKRKITCLSDLNDYQVTDATAQPKST